MNGYVNALALSSNGLYAGGWFTLADGVSTTNIARWDGDNWWPVWLGVGGPYDVVFALAVSGDDVYAGGTFTNASGTAASFIAKSDGLCWKGLGSGLDFYPRTLAASGNDLYVGGSFTTAGGKMIPNIARAYLLPLPALTVLRSGSNVKVSWPSTNTDGFALEHASGVATSASWLSNTASVNDDGTNKWVAVPATNGAQFFRLRRP